MTQQRVPVLRPGDVVIVDNPPAQELTAVRQAIKATGARLRFLPLFAPDFNPIELAFATIKAILKTTASQTVEALWDAVRAAIDAITPRDAAAFFTACGYDPEG